MSPPPEDRMRGGIQHGKEGKSGRIENRAEWNESRTWFLVSILKEYNSAKFRAQNGWTKEAWNSMTKRINDQFATNFVVSQLKDREQRLKKDYNVVKDIVSKSGFGWDNDLKMASTVDGVWDDLPQNLRIWKDKPFPFYDDLHEIYNGKVAEGKRCRRSSEKAQKVENKFEEEDGQMRTPSPSQPVFRGSMVDLLQGGIDLNNDSGIFFDIHDSQYRSMVEEQEAREEQVYASPEILGRHEREKKKSKKTENPMNELIALRKEELQTYKELTERQLQLKNKQIEQNNPVNDPYSLSKCMEKLNSLSLPQPELLKAIHFLKGDREAREILMCCTEESLANAYIKGSISI